MESKFFIVLLVLVLSPQISNAGWCIAKEGSPISSLQNALDYACGPIGQADCSKIQPGGPCFQPNTIISHASFAFNSYYKKFQSKGATCSFNGIAVLTDINPSSNGCQYD